VNLVAAWGWKQLGVLLGVLALTTTLFSLYGWSAVRRRRVRQDVAAGTSEATPFVAIGGVAVVISVMAVGVLLVILLAVWVTN
jgi:hypothetical protein